MRYKTLIQSSWKMHIGFYDYPNPKQRQGPPIHSYWPSHILVCQVHGCQGFEAMQVQGVEHLDGPVQGYWRGDIGPIEIKLQQDSLILCIREGSMKSLCQVVGLCWAIIAVVCNLASRWAYKMLELPMK
jgi:hypothetical protein